MECVRVGSLQDFTFTLSKTMYPKSGSLAAIGMSET